MSAHSFASSVVALIVALFNGLLAGYVLASARGEPRKALFACAPAGVALFATAWFTLLLEPRTHEALRVAVGLAALLSISGFTADALLDLPPSRGRRGLLASLTALGAVLLAVLVLAPSASSLAVLLPRALALGLVLLLGGVRLWLSRQPGAAGRQLSRHVVALIIASLVLCALRAGLDMAQGVSVGNALLLCVMLVAETVTLSYVLHERVAVHLSVSRAVALSVLMLLVVLVAVAAYRSLGYPVDLVQVGVTAGVALLAALLFVGLGEHLQRGIELLLFPKQVRLAGQLSASRAEAATLRGRLERAERLAIAGELAASVAHEVKNPLAAVRGYAELLAGHAAHVPPERRASFEKAVRIIREESDRIDARVAELLSLGRAPRGERGGSVLDVSRAVLEAVAVAEGEPATPPILPRLDPALRALGDEDTLRGVLLNLLKNAAEAMHTGRGGRVEVLARAEGGRAIIEVLDEGEGLSGVDAAQLFRPFYTTKPGGTGLGLAICRSALDALGGQLSLRPREDGPGAVARVELPLAPAESPLAVEKAS